MNDSRIIDAAREFYSLRNDPIDLDEDIVPLGIVDELSVHRYFGATIFGQDASQTITVKVPVYGFSVRQADGSRDIQFAVDPRFQEALEDEEELEELEELERQIMPILGAYKVALSPEELKDVEEGMGKNLLLYPDQMDDIRITTIGEIDEWFKSISAEEKAELRQRVSRKTGKNPLSINRIDLYNEKEQGK